jgi:hypothetical protein
VIGERWLSSADRHGRVRLAAPQDWVRRELALGFAAGKRVIPVLTSAARMPTEQELPREISKLARCQYRRIEHRQFRSGMYQLAGDLMALVPGLAAMGNGQRVLGRCGAGQTVGMDDRLFRTGRPSLGGWP